MPSQDLNTATTNSQQAFGKSSKGQEDSSKSKFDPLKLVDNIAKEVNDKKLESDSESGSESESESDSESESEPNLNSKVEGTVVIKMPAIANQEVDQKEAATKESTKPAARNKEASDTNDEQVKAKAQIGVQKAESSESEEESESDDGSEEESGESDTDDSDDESGEESDDDNMVDTEAKRKKGQKKDLKRQKQEQVTEQPVSVENVLLRYCY